MPQRVRSNFLLVLACLLAASAGSPSLGAAELGLRVSALYDGAPLQGIGIVARWPLRDGYFAEASMDRLRFSQDRLLQGATVGTTRSPVFGVAIGREFGVRGRLHHWFWSSGLAAANPSRSGQTRGEYKATLNAATEIHVTGALGVSRWLADNWQLQGTIRVERHFTDRRVYDGNGRLLSRQRSRSVSGLALTLSHRF